MIHAVTPTMRAPIRVPMVQPIARRRAAVQGGFGRKMRPLMIEVRQEQPQTLFWGLTSRDAKEFMMAYCACFMAVIGFIA